MVVFSSHAPRGVVFTRTFAPNVPRHYVLCVWAVDGTGMDWKLSLATGSHLSAKVNAPVVVLRFRVAGANGEIACHSVELTVAEFEVTANVCAREEGKKFIYTGSWREHARTVLWSWREHARTVLVRSS
jgi:hypothetical protein